MEVPSGQRPTRIDVYLGSILPHLSRTEIQRGIREEGVLVNSTGVKPSYKVQGKDELLIFHKPRSYELIPQKIPLDIVYEDSHLLVVNKPAGMVVHPAYGNWENTLANGLCYYLQGGKGFNDEDNRSGLVHRLDKDTSGLLLVGKTPEVVRSLSELFFHHNIERSYLAIVWGNPEHDTQTIETNLGRDKKDRRIVSVYPDGNYGHRAVTHYKVVSRFVQTSLLECRLETGRTHQIRAHMKHVGHPVFNDATYGGDRILGERSFPRYESFIKNCFGIMKRQALHARTLGFAHPVTGEKKSFHSPIPGDFQMLKNKLQKFSETLGYPGATDPGSEAQPDQV